jgi:hypothetical protein
MRRTACTEPQYLFSRAIFLLTLLCLRPVQGHCACTVELYLYNSYGPYALYSASESAQKSHNSTYPMGRTACTVPLYLYSRAIHLLPLWAVRPVQSLSVCTVELNM